MCLYVYIYILCRNTGATCVHLKEVVKIQPDAMLDICSPVAFSIESGQVGALEVKFTARYTWKNS